MHRDISDTRRCRVILDNPKTNEVAGRGGTWHPQGWQTSTPGTESSPAILLSPPGIEAPAEKSKTILPQALSGVCANRHVWSTNPRSGLDHGGIAADSDLIEDLDALLAARADRMRPAALRDLGLDVATAQAVDRAAQQLERQTRRGGRRPADDAADFVILGSGASGATAARVLTAQGYSCFIRRQRGDDVAALDVRRLRRRVGMVFQRPTPFPGTVHENLRVAEPSLDEDGAIALLASVGLPAEFVEREALTLSGGEAQRMCTARTLATRPEAVLMDEPTSALDEDNARGVEELARSLVGVGVSIVWVTHDRAQMDRIADVVIRLDGGRIVSGES